MGQDELVLKIPAPMPEMATRQPSSNLRPNGGVVNRKTLTHSRESSGASVKFVNGDNKRSDDEDESKVIILSHSDDLTSCSEDRLSMQDDEEDIEEELKRGCMEDFHERLALDSQDHLDRSV